MEKIEKKFRIFLTFFFEFFWSPVSRIVPKNLKRDPLGVFEHPFFCKIEKNEEGILWRHLKKLRKNSHKAETSRERPKSAPYLRLKNSKRTSKCQVLSSTVPKKNFQKFFEFF